MAPPTSGNYYIKNKASGYYLSSLGDGNDKSGTPVYTQKPSTLGPEFSFNLRKGDSDLYIISANLSGANVGNPADLQPGSTVIWTVGEQQFRILDAGPGVFGIRVVTENKFWYDDVAKNQPKRTVLIKPGKTDDSSYWIFQAA